MDGRGTVPYGNEGGVWMGGAQYPMEMREGLSPRPSCITTPDG